MFPRFRAHNNEKKSHTKHTEFFCKAKLMDFFFCFALFFCIYINVAIEEIQKTLSDTITRNYSHIWINVHHLWDFYPIFFFSLSKLCVVMWGSIKCSQKSFKLKCEQITDVSFKRMWKRDWNKNKWIFVRNNCGMAFL